MAFSGITNKGEQKQKCSPTRGTNSDVAASHLPFRGPKRGRKCYVTPAFLGSTTKEEGNKSGPRQWKKAPQSWGQNQKWPTSGRKVLQPSSFVFGGFET